jgi:hypothetical protein
VLLSATGPVDEVDGDCHRTQGKHGKEAQRETRSSRTNQGHAISIDNSQLLLIFGPMGLCPN